MLRVVKRVTPLNTLANWEKTKHSHAYHTLVEKGHEKDPECLTCHTVGFGFQTSFISQPQTPTLMDVGCENCHGVGGNHVKNLQPGYGQVAEADCLTCHTSENSPNFDYNLYFPKIRPSQPPVIDGSFEVAHQQRRTNTYTQAQTYRLGVPDEECEYQVQSLTEVVFPGPRDGDVQETRFNFIGCN